MSVQLLSPVWTRLTSIQPVRGLGIYLWDAKDCRYTDFTSGIGVTNTGHCHPVVVSAIQEQASKLLFGQMNIVIPPITLELAQTLHEIMPKKANSDASSALNRFFFSNSGAEAVEASVKLARHATGRTNVIVMQGSFHGRTHQTMAMTTSKYVYRTNYSPLPSGICVTPFPFTHYYHNNNNNGWNNNDEEKTVDFCIRELETLLKGQSRPEDTAAIILEPVLGEGGYVPVPQKYLQYLRKLCDQHGILLIADEVQSGFGRTGKMFATEHYTTTTTTTTPTPTTTNKDAAVAAAGDNNTITASPTATTTTLIPDILVMAKGLGSGLPISGIAANADLMDRWIPGSHGGTYGGGSCIAAAAAVATIRVLQSEGLLDNATQRGHQLQTALKRIQTMLLQQYGNGSCILTDVRGIGLMVASEFDTAAHAKAVQHYCLQHHNLLLLTCGTYENIIRWAPPLVVTESQMDEAIHCFEQAVHHVAAKAAAAATTTNK